jgi:hypothetical protein
MKVAIITDTHWGARNDSAAFIEFYRKFYSNCFFPTLEEHGIDTVFMLGDTFDRRKYTNHSTIQSAKRYYFDELERKNIKTHILIGNHDTFYKNTNEVNTIELMLSEYKNLNPISSPTTIDIDGTLISMIPWICADNYLDSMNEMNNTKAEICMGHLEIVGFEMYRGHECHEGLSLDTFKRFDKVFSGHYHHRSTKGNVTYLGTPYELTWQDYDDQKGFHIFDLDTRELQFIPNPYTMFARLEYDDKEKEPLDLDTLDLTDMYIKLVVVNKTDYYKFDQFINKLYTKNAHDIKIVEDMSEFESGTVDTDIDLEDTLSILSNYIDSVNTDVDKEKIKTFMKTLYTEAVNQEVV